MSLGTGLGRVKGRVFRIGHLGDFNDLTLMGTLAGVEMGLHDAGVPHRQGGVAAAMDYLMALDRAAVAAHEHDLLAYARQQVGQFNWLKVIGDAPGKGAILSFEAEGMHAHDLATILDREGVAVRAGHHCAQVLMERFGVASTIRASFGLYNNRADVDALLAGLHKAREILG